MKEALLIVSAIALGAWVVSWLALRADSRFSGPRRRGHDDGGDYNHHNEQE
jgi:hypothetical protein